MSFAGILTVYMVICGNYLLKMSERPSDELRRAGVKLETNTLAYSGLFYVS